MFNFIKNLFGEGYIYGTAVCSDGSQYNVRAPYVGDKNTFDENDKQEYIENVTHQVEFTTGKTVNNVKFKGLW